MKKNLILLTLLIFTSGTITAQNSGRILGKLQEADKKTPVSLATVGLFSGKDSSLVSGVNSSESGQFALENLGLGNYYLKITMVGYAPKTIPNISLSAAQPVADLGSITLASNTKKLSEVEIVAQKDLVELGLDKLVINVAKDLSSVGGTAADALKNAPSVAVDVDGKVSVRGSANLTVLVDGKNAGQDAQTLLSQTPASAIEKLEVITNPSAKYDAEGMGGIINIILKKETKPGLNGNVIANVGTSNNYNTSLALNYNVKKFNFFANYDFNQNSRSSEYQLVSNRNGYYLEQNQNGSRLSRMHMPKFGFDYQLSEFQTVSLTAKSFISNMKDEETIYQKEVTQQAAYSSRFGSPENVMQGTDLIASYRKTFADKRREFTASAVYTIFKGRFDKFNKLENTNADHNPVDAAFYQNFLQSFHVNPFVAQVDYVHPVGEKGKIETGLKHNQRVLTSEFRTEQAGPGYSNLMAIDSLTNKFGFGDYVSAAYASYSNGWKKLSYQVGLRAEQTSIRYKSYSDTPDYSKDYLNLFPSVFLSREIDERRKMQVSYSRRVNRPGYEALNPYKNYADKYNVSVGNPKLQPEYVNAFEASYIQFWKYGSLTGTAFYRDINNLIQQVRYLDPADTIRAYNSYVNLNDAQSYGVELSGGMGLSRWWRINGNVSAFNYKISGNPAGIDASSGQFSWLTRVSSSFSLPKNLSLQISYNYRSPQAIAQGTKAAIYSTDIALKKDVLKKKGSITLRVSDVFNTLRGDSYTSSDTFTNDIRSKRQSRIAFLGFSYRFGGEQEKRRRTEINSGLDGMF